MEGTKGDDFVGVIGGGGALRPILGNFTISLQCEFDKFKFSLGERINGIEQEG